uniref:DUF1641 domain-containing protein n=1 Tax=Nitratidesulfovibrio vulgaris (strain DSM 19637 / Miyazaki F) TaxID=883 RepID=B8DJY6_NITV9
MTNEELILQRLEAMEERIAFLHERAMGTKYFIEEVTPIGNHAFRLMVEELQDVHGHVHLDDIFELLRRGLRSVPNLNYCLDQLENLIDLWRTMHPAVAPTWPHIIEGLGKWEQDGVFAKLSALKGAGGKVLDANTPEGIEKMGDALAFMTVLLQKLADPNVQVFLARAVDMLAKLDLSQAKPVGMFGMVGALGSKEAKEGLGVAMEVLKALGALKGDGCCACGCAAHAPAKND